jgi:hypothetical protein
MQYWGDEMLSNRDKREVLSTQINQIEREIYGYTVNAQIRKEIGDDVSDVIKRLERLQMILDKTRERLEAIPEEDGGTE